MQREILPNLHALVIKMKLKLVHHLPKQGKHIEYFAL